jgi:hypothetical protein
VSAETRRLLAAGLERAGDRLDRIERLVATLDQAMVQLEERLGELERRAWLPASSDLQRDRYATIVAARRRGLSVTAIARLTSMSRSRVAAIVATLPVPETTYDINGRPYPARAMAAHRRRNGVPGAA